MNKNNLCLTVITVVLILILIMTVIITLKHVVYDINYANKVNSIMADSVEIEKKWLINKE